MKWKLVTLCYTLFTEIIYRVQMGDSRNTQPFHRVRKIISFFFYFFSILSKCRRRCRRRRSPNKQWYRYIFNVFFLFHLFQTKSGACHWQLQPIYTYHTESKLELSIYGMCRSLMMLEKVISFHFFFYFRLNVHKLNVYVTLDWLIYIKLIFIYPSKYPCEFEQNSFFIFDVEFIRTHTRKTGRVSSS